MKQLRLLLMSVLFIVPIRASTAASNYCFPEVKAYCVEAPFDEYWVTNGGLPVFGYPISAKDRYQAPDQGPILDIQWTERQRLEQHKTLAGTAYEIQIGLLGKERMAQLNRDLEPAARRPAPDCLWFAATGHNVCNQADGMGFKQFWQSHGTTTAGLDSYARSLQLFGLPLTSAQFEVNPDGDEVITQWFERARFEWHPDNPDQFKVLLGRLGSEITGFEPEIIPEPIPGPNPPNK
ncbi:hypothetical protein [Herpetosiphon geysericola]|uniref:hypothetical protein n=1 Tax=Herpetosiphon geysericola TaxID=70996 RepID=UPI0006C91385|nr:hypothetical protein [Herpetosiphon geysericola]